jgi:uncharacterized protein YerC
MFATFNYDNFPIIHVNFTNNLNEQSLNEFFKEWLSLYLKSENFIFLFDTRNITEIPNIKYALRMSQFIKKLKRENTYHYLQKSIILINNNKISYLLDFIFNIQKPVAPVYILKTDDTNLINLIQIAKFITSEKKYKNLTFISP